MGALLKSCVRAQLSRYGQACCFRGAFRTRLSNVILRAPYRSREFSRGSSSWL